MDTPFNSIINNNGYGIDLDSKDCSIRGNLIANNGVGLHTRITSGNTISHNEFINNNQQVILGESSDNWYLPYPYGGNYWSDHIGNDVKKGPQQDKDGSDGFVDTPYTIDESSERDLYPRFKDLISPVAVAGPDVTINSGEIYHFDATGSHDDQLIHHIVWEWDYGEEHKKIELMEFDFRFDIPGKYWVNLTVLDFYGNTDTSSINITVIDRTNPVAITQGNISINQEEIAYFNGSASTDNDIIVNWTWVISLIDEEVTRLYGPTPQFQFITPGVYTVSLLVKDRAGNEGFTVFFVNVTDLEDPVAVAGEDVEINNGETVEFDTGNSYDNGLINDIEWEFVYDGELILLKGTRSSFLFEIPGYYNVTLTLIDEYGNIGVDYVHVTVIDTIKPVPVISGSLSVLEGESLSLDGLASTDNGKIVKYVWNFNDTEPIQIEGPYLNYSFERKGYIDVRLTVFDEWNNSDAVEVIVDVADFTSPNAVAGDDKIVNLGETVTLNGSGSTDDGTIVTWEWSFEYSGENKKLVGEKVDFTFEIPGEYIILLSVYDQSDNMGEDRVKITAVSGDDDDIVGNDDVNGKEFPVVIVIIVAVVILVIIGLVVFLLMRKKPPEEEQPINEEKKDLEQLIESLHVSELGETEKSELSSMDTQILDEVSDKSMLSSFPGNQSENGIIGQVPPPEIQEDEEIEE